MIWPVAQVELSPGWTRKITIPVLIYPLICSKELQSEPKKKFNQYRLMHANAEEQIFPDNSFDLVMTDAALHMIPDWQKTIMAAANDLDFTRITTNGGMLYFQACKSRNQ